MDFSTVNITLYSDFNETFPEPYRRKFFINVLGSALTVFLALTSILGNLAVVFASYLDKALGDQTSNLLLVYLSMTDILTGFLIMLPGATSVALDYWPFGSLFCKFHAGLAYMFACSSSFNIAFISIDRAVAVLKPLQYTSMVTTRLMILICIFLFFMGLTVLLPTALFDFTYYEYEEGACSNDYNFYEVHLISSWGCTSCYYIPATIMGLCNALIVVSAFRQKTQKLFIRRKEAGFLKKPSKDSNMNKTITSMVVVVIVYYTTYSPYTISKHVRASLGVTLPPWANYMTTILLYFSSAINPFIYGILRKDYRNAYKKIPQILSRKFFR